MQIFDGSWGSRSTSSYDNHILFAGYYRDTETGLYHVRNRMYHPHVSWLQRDPLGYADGMSLYEYVNSNPLRWRDAFGLQAAPPVAPPAPPPPAPPAPPPVAPPVAPAAPGALAGVKAVAGTAFGYAMTFMICPLAIVCLMPTELDDPSYSEWQDELGPPGPREDPAEGGPEESPEEQERGDTTSREQPRVEKRKKEEEEEQKREERELERIGRGPQERSREDYPKKDKSEQRDDIEEEQSKRRKGGQGDSIDSIDKSKQRGEEGDWEKVPGVVPPDEDGW